MNINFIAKNNAVSDFYPVKPAGLQDTTIKVEAPEITCTNNVVTITAVAGASIVYSTDGTTYAAYTSPIAITETTTFYAKASKADMTDSDVTTKLCEYVPPVVATPVISCENNIVSITCDTEGASIVYSTDGTDYMAYTAPITITGTLTFYAKASKEGYVESAVAQQECVYVPEEINPEQ